MFELLQLLLPSKLLLVALKPLVRLILGVLAVPMSRLFLHRVVRLKALDEELERDLTLWIRGSLILLVATANMESTFFEWVPPQIREKDFLILAARLMLAMSVIETMPDQALFSIIHPGPPPLQMNWSRPWHSLLSYAGPFAKGVACKHLNRSSPVLAILAVIFTGRIGWICYGIAITNYLIIGLMSSRDRAADILRKFDSAISERRHELIEELESTAAIEEAVLLSTEPKPTRPQPVTTSDAPAR